MNGATRASDIGGNTRKTYNLPFCNLHPSNFASRSNNARENDEFGGVLIVEPRESVSLRPILLTESICAIKILVIPKGTLIPETRRYNWFDYQREY